MVSRSHNPPARRRVFLCPERVSEVIESRGTPSEVCEVAESTDNPAIAVRDVSAMAEVERRGKWSAADGVTEIWRRAAAVPCRPGGLRHGRPVGRPPDVGFEAA